MSGTSLRFNPRLESMDTRANPSSRSGISGEVFTDTHVATSEVQVAEFAPIGGVWVGGEDNGGRGGLGGEV